MNTLVDTNILARSASPDHHQHTLAQDAVRVLLKQGERLCIVPQVLYEFWTVATRPVSQNGLGKSVAEARADVAHFKRLLRFYRDERAIFEQWEILCDLYNVQGKAAHDARLAAAMLRHRMDAILTFNASDFSRYADIKIITPVEAINSTVDS
jgi:predicted nucleic acid-binding protein